MLKLQTEKVTINKSKETLLGKISDINSFSNAIPDQVSNLKIEGDSLSFDVMGGTTISMTKDNSYTEGIKYVATGKLNFDLLLKIDDNEQGLSCYTQLFFEGSFNPMIEMMAKKPLSNFIESIQNNLINL